MNINEEYFRFLNRLRDSGQINMFGAVPYLQEAFDLNRNEAKNIMLKWMESFQNDNSN